MDAADEEQRAAVEILGAGTGLHWEGLDIDVSVPGLLAKVFGTSAYMAQRARRTISPAKSTAARTNGRKGGRPKTIVR